MRPLTPQALGSHAVLVAMLPEGMEVVFGEDDTNRLSLAIDCAILVPTSSSYRLVSCGCDPRLLVVVRTRQEPGTGHQGPEPCAVAVEEDKAEAAPVGHEGETAGRDTQRPTAEGRQKEQGPEPGAFEVDEEVDVKAHVEAALARIMAAAGPPPATEAMEEGDQSRESSKVRETKEEDMKDSRSRGRRRRTRWCNGRWGWRTGLGPIWERWKPSRIGPRGGALWADACGFAHPQPPVPEGVPQDLLLILMAIAREGALSLHRSQHHETLRREVVERARGGGLPAVG